MRIFHYLCSVKQQIEYIISQLRESYSYEESRELAYWILEEIYGLTRAEILIGCKDTKKNVNAQANTTFHEHSIENIVEKLKAHMPIQYIFGHTEWMGLDILLTPSTLIPRPETAELVEWICQKYSPDVRARVLDIGTGSGCIAIALKQRAPLWQVTGLDISPDALEIAKKNATRNNVQVDWIQIDILNEELKGDFDIIVSNPPYICDNEKVDMEARVLDYEPHSALFVPDNDPLLFYRRIADLKPSLLFFEINEAYGEAVCAMMKEKGYTNIELKNDIYGKPRMVFGAINRQG